jgi:tetratricopeptide (TPR) repeat protein
MNDATEHHQIPAGALAGGAPARAWVLRVGPERTTLSGECVEATGPHPRPDIGFADLLAALRIARGGQGKSPRATPGREVSRAIGLRLADAYLPDAVAAALSAALAEAEARNCALELALDIAAPLQDLPWETLRVGGAWPLALHPRVALSRLVATELVGTLRPTPGDVRVLCVVAGAVGPLDTALTRLLEATEVPSRTGRLLVDVIERGSVAAIRVALARLPYHVLYLPAGATPEALILEDVAGGEELVTARRFRDEAIPAGRSPPPLIIVGATTPGGSVATLARALVASGAPAVIALPAAVDGDGNAATRMLGGICERLAGADEKSPADALAYARRQLAAQGDGDEAMAPVLFCGAAPMRLFGPAPALPAPVAGPVATRPGARRAALHHLLGPNGRGLLLQGIGGSGRTALAASVLRSLMTEAGFVVVTVAGATDPDQLLGAVADRLLSVASAENDDEQHPCRVLARVLRSPGEPWRHRFEFLARTFLATVPTALLLDDLDDNIVAGALEPELAALLSRWLRAAGPARVLFAARHPFGLPDGADGHITILPLGPLPWPEARLWFRQLAGLQRLGTAEQHRAYALAGGHPGPIGLLSTILGDDAGGFAAVDAMLRARLAAAGIDDPAGWCAGDATDLAPAEPHVLIVGEALLDHMLARADDAALSRQLLLGAAILREPVAERGLAWMAADVAAARELLHAGLLQPMRREGERQDRFFVPRWIAATVAGQASRDALHAVHRAAAGYWEWQARQPPGTAAEAIGSLLHVRHHMHACADAPAMHAATGALTARLQAMGAHECAERVLRETLRLISGGSREAASLHHRLGEMLQRRGNVEPAFTAYRRAQALHEQLGDRAGVARSLSRMGELHTDAGRPEAGIALSLRSLGLRLEMQDPESRADLLQLARQRQLLGPERFRARLAEHLDTANLEAVERLLARFAAAGGRSAA